MSDSKRDAEAYHLEQAKRLLEEAGYAPNGNGSYSPKKSGRGRVPIARSAAKAAAVERPPAVDKSKG